MTTLHDRIEAAYDYLRSQLAEGSTVRGIVAMATLVGGLKLTKFPPEAVLTVTMLASQSMKILLPDDLPSLPRWPWSKKPPTP
jgi:hypothetical protein